MEVKKQTAINEQAEMKDRFMTAANGFVSKVKSDPNVIAVIICGSLAYDDVWENSDIDMTLVVRDQALNNHSYCVVEDDITINVSITVRSGFKRYLESVGGGSFTHSYFSRGRILYSSDDSLYEYFEDYKKMGMDDLELSVFFIACELVNLYDKCMKWLTVKKNLLYTQYYLLKAAESIARMEVCLSGEPPMREAILKAYDINSELITPYYNEAMSHHLNKEETWKAIKGIEQYLCKHIDTIKKPLLDYMSDHEIKTVTMITKYFRTDGHFIIAILDYLADMGVIDKVSQTIRITPKSKLSVEEIAYVYVNKQVF